MINDKKKFWFHFIRNLDWCKTIEFMMELDIYYYLPLKDTTPFTMGLDIL